MEKYFETEATEVAERINHYKQEGCFVFSVFSDMHTHRQTEHGEWCMIHTLETMKEVHRNCDIDGLFFLGDAFMTDYNIYPPEYWTLERVNETFKYLNENMKEANRNSFYIAGNHDGINAGYPEHKHFYEHCVKNNVPDCKISKVENKGYYYLDFPEKNVRCICLVSCYNENGTNYAEYSKDQILWLCNDALNVKEDTNIFLFMHFPPVCIYPESYSLELCKLTDAYKQRKNYENGGKLFDFRNAKGKICAAFVGDGHYDWISKNGFACPVVEIAASSLHQPKFKQSGWWMPEGATSPKRCFSSRTEVLWDTVVFNPVDNDMVIIRFGAGTDRYCKI